MIVASRKTTANRKDDYCKQENTGTKPGKQLGNDEYLWTGVQTDSLSSGSILAQRTAAP